MTQKDRKRIAWLVLGLSLGLLAMGALRLASVHESPLTPLAGFATPGYVLVTVFFTILLVRAGLPLNRLGFGMRPSLRHLLLAAAAIAVLHLLGVLLEPVLEQLFGGARDMERFAGVEGSASALVSLLLLSWTFAAFGEELAYRIVLMRGIAFALGDSRAAQVIALVLQALMFGLVHAYQGPTGIASTTIHGLVFGAVTLAGRRSIWPAALAHGGNNTIGILGLYHG